MSACDDDHASLLRSHASGAPLPPSCPSPRGGAAGHQQQHHADFEADEATVTASPRRGGGVRGLLRHLERRMSARGSGHGRRPHQQHYQQLDRPVLAEQPSQRQWERPDAGEDDELGDGAPPEWALLLIGCLLGLATGICVAAFNRGVSLRFLVIRMVDVAVGVAVHLSWFGCGVVGCNILGSLLLECITAIYWIRFTTCCKFGSIYLCTTNNFVHLPR